MVFAHTQAVPGPELTRALASEAARRGIELPTTFATPDAAGWATGYARVARDVPGLAERDLEAARTTVKPRELESGSPALGLTSETGHLGAYRCCHWRGCTGRFPISRA